MQSTDDELHCIRYSLLMPCAPASVPTDWYLRVEKQSTPPVQALANVAITPPTFSIKQLKKADSDQYQELAQACAEERGIPRGRLDIELWEPQRQRRGEQLASQRLK